MQSFQVVLSNRDATPRFAPSDVQMLPTRYSWTAIGGPQDAEVTVTGPELSVWEAIEWLRCPVVIMRSVGAEPVWWGYVHEVEVRTRSFSLGVSLDGMANTVSVIYSLVTPGSQVVGARSVSGPASDTVSVAAYGRKDARITANNLTAAAADKRRDGELAIRRYPQPVIGQGGEPGATLRLRGWWQTLDWQYYSQATATGADTTAQVAAMITAAGAFLAGTLVRSTSGLSTGQYRDGEKTARDYIEELLSAGTTNGRRMLATVRSDLWAEVSEEPVSDAGADYYVDKALQLWTPIGTPVERWRCPLGWARLKDVIPGSADVSLLGSVNPFYIEESEYSVTDDALTWRSRNAPSPWEMALPVYAAPAQPSTAVNDVTQFESLVHLTRTGSDYAIPTGSPETPIPFDNEVVDGDNLHDVGTNPNRVTVKYAGRYEITTKAQFTQNASGWRRMAIMVNGVQKAKKRVDGTANTETQMDLTATLPLSAGDYIELWLSHNAGITLYAVRDDDLPSIVVKRVQ